MLLLLTIFGKIMLTFIFWQASVTHFKDDKTMTFGTEHGFSRWLVWLAGLIHGLCAFGILFGVVPVISALVLAGLLYVITLTLHVGGNGSYPDFMRNLTIIGALLLIAVGYAHGVFQPWTLSDPVIQTDNFEIISESFNAD